MRLLSLFALMVTAYLHADSATTSHVHGRGHLYVTVVGNKLAVEVRVTGHDVVGFEREARSEQQRQAIATAKKNFKDHAKIIVLPDEGRCLISAKPKIVFVVNGKNERHVHRDFRATYEFTCTDIDKVKQVDAQLFTLYPQVTHLDARWTAKGHNSYCGVNPNKTVFSI